MHLWVKISNGCFYIMHIKLLIFPYSVIESLTTRMRHGKERGHNAKTWEEIWPQFSQKKCKVCFIYLNYISVESKDSQVNIFGFSMCFKLNSMYTEGMEHAGVTAIVNVSDYKL